MLTQILINLENLFRLSPFAGLGVSFLAGVLVSFSPCSYPLIAVTLGVVGVASINSRIKSFFLSLLFVSGIVFVYLVFGVIASLAGILLNKLYLNPFTYLFLTFFFLFLGLAQIGLIRLKIPFFDTSGYLNRKKSKFSIFIFGVISGLAIIPCNFPVLGTIFGLIALRQNVAYGLLSLLLFSLGYGVIFILVGTSVSLIRKLPKYNIYFKTIRVGLGVLLIALSLFFACKTITLF